jgi:hypothetical protein
MRLHQDTHNFLKTLYDHEPEGARRHDLPPASRWQDKVRQYARKRKWVVYENRGKGARWHLTPEGQAVFIADRNPTNSK